jgi:hypothetical protein
MTGVIEETSPEIFETELGSIFLSRENVSSTVFVDGDCK